MMLWRNPHRRFQERLSAYVDGELPPDEALAVETHVESCDSCAREVADIRLASAALAELPEVDLPRSFALTPEHVGQPAAAPRTIRSINSGLRVAGGALAAALAVLLVLDIGGVVGNGRGADEGATEMERQAAYDLGTGATESPEALAPAPTGGAGGVGRAVGGVGGPAATPLPPEISPTPLEDMARDEAAFQAQTPAPAPTEAPGDAAAALGLNGSEGEDTETFTREDSTTDSDDGPSALTVTEIVLAALLGASIIGIGAATYAGRRRG